MSVQSDQNCDGLNLPAVTANFCDPDVNFGQIDAIYIGNIGQPLTDWSSLPEWQARLDNADVSGGNNKIRTLFVVGDKPQPEKTAIPISQGREVASPKKHTVNIKVDETGDLNYALLKAIEGTAGQAAQVAIWYAAGKYLYGGNEGICASLVLDDVIPESDEELDQFIGTIVWEGETPDRINNPLD